MTNHTVLYISFAVMLLSFAFSPFAIQCARKLSIMDAANHRSSHTGITPRGGGIVFAVVFYIGIAFLYFFSPDLFSIPIIVILIGSLMMAVIGWLDDFKNLPVSIRFGFQIAAVVIGVVFFPRIWLFVPAIIEKAVIAFSWLWFINLFNFMDGTDGYAAQEAFFICLGLFLLTSSAATGNVALALGCAVLGFLRVNYPKAKIFMGDVGSVFLGYALGGLIAYSITINDLNILRAAALTSLFIFDATYTLLKRILQRKRVWQAHREHWYQRLNILGAGHKVIFYVGVIYNITVICVLSLNRFNRISDLAAIAILLLILISIALYIKRKERLTGK